MLLSVLRLTIRFRMMSKTVELLFVSGKTCLSDERSSTFPLRRMKVSLGPDHAPEAEYLEFERFPSSIPHSHSERESAALDASPALPRNSSPRDVAVYCAIVGHRATAGHSATVLAVRSTCFRPLVGRAGTVRASPPKIPANRTIGRAADEWERPAPVVVVACELSVAAPPSSGAPDAASSASKQAERAATPIERRASLDYRDCPLIAKVETASADSVGATVLSECQM